MITFQNLTKTYGSFTAVDDISFEVPAGSVTGFLGPNGAGKSTSLRCLVGLTPATSGTATVCGRRYVDLPNPARHVGVMLDASAQHPGRTGREALTLAALQMGLPKTSVAPALERVGLDAKEARRRVRHYSLGMRQRLGIAAALLGEPQVLVLDEPANGLDPQGIRWMRDLLRNFANDGGTVLLSSHLLHEVQQIADNIVMIGHGRIVAQGTLSELLGASARVRIRAVDEPALATALREAGLTVTETAPANGLSVEGDAETVARIAAASGAVVLEMQTENTRDIEQMFLELTSTTDRQAGAVA